MKEEIIRLNKITQIIDGVTLLDSLSMHIFRGEIFGLLCINNHGKEALIQILCQNIHINFGEVYFLESLSNSYKYSSMTMNSVLLIEKPIRLVEDLTVEDNIFVLRHGAKKYFVNQTLLSKQLQMYSDELDIKFEPNTLVKNLSFYEQSVVLLLKAYITGIKLVILRDLSNFISAIEMHKLHRLLRKLTEKNMTFLYICNHHEESYKICDRVALMENGSVIKNLDKSDFTDEIISFFTHEFFDNKEYKSKIKDEIILDLKDIYSENLKKFSLCVRKAECLVILDNSNTALRDVQDLLTAFPQTAMIPENPIQTMLFKELSCLENLCFLLDHDSKSIRLRRALIKSIINEYTPLIGENIYFENISNMDVFSLYSLAYYRIHLYNPKFVVCVQPFSGADMYLRFHIIKLINALLEKNISVIILAVNISDNLYVADRLLVLEKGYLKEEFLNKDFHKFGR